MKIIKVMMKPLIAFILGVLVGWWVKPYHDKETGETIHDEDVMDKKRAEQKEIETVNLCGVTDAMIWVDEWARIIKENPKISTDQGTMLTWFANAIMAGYDHAVRQYETDTVDKSLADTQPIKVCYTAEEIMPISGKPDDYSLYWVFDANDKLWRKAEKFYESLWSDGNLILTNVSYYIPVAGAPEELKPVKGKPKESGVYICHHKETDVWRAMKWDREFWYVKYHGDCTTLYISFSEVDWFIPYRLPSADVDK